MSGVRMKNHSTRGVPSGSAASNLMAAEMHHRSALMTKERRVKFTFLLLGSALITSVRKESKFSVIPSIVIVSPSPKVNHQNTSF